MLSADNQERNKIWTQKFDEAFENNDAQGFLDFINNKTRLKPIFTSASNVDFAEFINPQNIINPILGIKNEEIPISVEISEDLGNKDFPINSIFVKTQKNPSKITLIASKSGHIQIKNVDIGNLFIERSDFDGLNINETDKDIIADGARGFDPFDQKDWVKVIGRQWPTAENTRDLNGVAKLSSDKTKKGIFLDTNLNITKSYGTKPRAMVILDEANNSVILSFQQENKNPDIDFAAWSVLPFKIREGRKTVAIFPADKKIVENYKNTKNFSFSEIRNNEQWNIDENNFFVVDVSKPSEKTEYIDPYADWCMFLTQGEDTACLVRSCCKDNTENNQMKVFSGQEDMGGTKYFEIEFIAPKVPKDKKSTLVYRIEFISLKDLGFNNLTEENMDSQVKEIAKSAGSKINWAKALSSLTFSDT